MKITYNNSHGQYTLYCQDFISKYNQGYRDGCTMQEDPEYTFIANLVESHISKDKIFLDIGANCGFSMFPVLQRGYRCIGVEPVKENFSLLEKGLAENFSSSSAELHNIALFDKDQELEIYYSSFFDNASLRESAAGYYVPGEVVSEKVICKTLDIFSSKNVGFVKIDTQGAETAILRGGSKLIEEKPIFFLEWDHNLSKEFGFEIEDIKSILKDYDFVQYGGNALFVPKTKQTTE